MIGAVKTRYGGFTIPMVILTVVNSMAVVYWGILTRFLPCKSSAKKLGAHLPEYHVSPSLAFARVLLSNPFLQACSTPSAKDSCPRLHV